MERLTEDYNDSYCLKKCYPNNDSFCDGDGRGCPIDNCGVVIEALNKLGEYEKAEEQGLLVRLPDDLNRILYQVNYRWKCTEYGEENNKCEIYDCKCECDIRKEYYIAEVDLQYISIKSYYNCLGEFLFLTREDAEKKLEKLQNNA